METKKVKCYLFKSPYGSETVYEKDSFSGYALIGVCESAEFAMFDPAEVVRNQIDALEAEKKKELADSQIRINAIDEKIQSLLAITHQP